MIDLEAEYRANIVEAEFYRECDVLGDVFPQRIVFAHFVLLCVAVFGRGRHIDGRRLEVAVIFGGATFELEHTVVGVGHALFVEQFIAELPYSVFCRLVGAYLHFADDRNALIFESSALVEIHASFAFGKIVFDLSRRRVCREVYAVVFYFARCEHGAYNGIAFLVHGSDKRRFLFRNKVEDLFFVH